MFCICMCLSRMSRCTQHQDQALLLETTGKNLSLKHSSLHGLKPAWLFLRGAGSNTSNERH